MKSRFNVTASTSIFSSEKPTTMLWKVNDRVYDRVILSNEDEDYAKYITRTLNEQYEKASDRAVDRVIRSEMSEMH